MAVGGCGVGVAAGGAAVTVAAETAKSAAKAAARLHMGSPLEPELSVGWLQNVLFGNQRVTRTRGIESRSMKTSDVVRFARRDWQLLSDLKADYWAAFKVEHGVAAAIRVSDELRRHAQQQHPGWPTEEDRRQDLEAHARVSAALQRVAASRRP